MAEDADLANAVRTGDLNALTSALDNGVSPDTCIAFALPGDDEDEVAESGCPLLVAATACGHLPLVELLLARDADVDATESGFECTAVFIAAQVRFSLFVLVANNPISRLLTKPSSKVTCE